MNNITLVVFMVFLFISEIYSQVEIKERIEINPERVLFTK